VRQALTQNVEIKDLVLAIAVTSRWTPRHFVILPILSAIVADRSVEDKVN
jgi:hypothetical protein